jgi:hypothetical protein
VRKGHESAWWSRARGLPKDVHASWLDSLTAQPGRPARILAWGTTPEGWCIGSPAALSYTGGIGWEHVGWHEIERGDWEAEPRRLSWVEYVGGGESTRPASVELTEPGRLPELFRERISASIAVQKFVAISGERGVLVTARRALGPAGEISWHGTLSKGLGRGSAGIREAVDQATAAVRSEYDLL